MDLDAFERLVMRVEHKRLPDTAVMSLSDARALFDVLRKERGAAVADEWAATLDALEAERVEEGG